MARKKNNRSKYRSGRDFNISIANRRLPPISPVLAINPFGVDDRLYNPQPIRRLRPTLTVHGNRSVVRSSFKKKGNLYAKTAFVLPTETAVCVRRQIRREVLFSSGRGGRKLNYKRVRRNRNSDVTCRR